MLNRGTQRGQTRRATLDLNDLAGLLLVAMAAVEIEGLKKRVAELEPKPDAPALEAVR